jgi:hypothetical protein
MRHPFAGPTLIAAPGTGVERPVLSGSMVFAAGTPAKLLESTDLEEIVAGLFKSSRTPPSSPDLPATTALLAEEGSVRPGRPGRPTTLAVGEEGRGPVTTLAFPEEGSQRPPVPSTRALGEE